ncbi:MAG: metal-dependent hydrolase [Pseudomarimonas sp.]
MDSLSQIVLGAAVCGIVSRQPLRRCLVYGAALGTLPDLDVLVLGHLDPVEQFVRHRSFSHSLFMLTAVALPMAWLLRRLDSALSAVDARRWSLAVWLSLITHPLLDACTVYGTQIWWPLMPPPTAWSNVFIIDPLYTLPLLVACALAWRRHRHATRVLGAGLLVAHAYLLFGLIAKQHVEQQVEAALQARSQPYDAILATPAPFTTLLWRVLVRTPDGHAEVWYSLRRGGDQPLPLIPIASDAGLRATLPALPALATLQWFSRGYLKAEVVNDRLRIADLRMGAEPDYFFAFEIAEKGADGWQSIAPQRVQMERPRATRLGEIIERL